MKKVVIVSVINDLFTDQRVGRTCKVLHDLGYDVLLVGRKKRDSKPLAELPYKTKRFRLICERGFLFYATYNIRLFFFLLFKRAHLLVSNDLDTLLPNYLISKIKGIPLVYDSHEYFIGVPEIQHRPYVKKVWLAIEKWIFPKLKNIITVNESIAALYKNEYAKEILVVRNISHFVKPEKIKTREALGMPADKKVVLLQGSGINIDRGAEEAVLSMKEGYGLKNVVLYIIGDGDVIEVLKDICKINDMGDRVKFIPKMPFNELFHYTANADLGLTLDKDSNINYRYSLPNKLFDYIHAGIPVLASNLVEVRKIIETYQIGMIAEIIEPLELADKIHFMLSDEKMTGNWKKNLKLATEELNWEVEQKQLINVFKQFI